MAEDEDGDNPSRADRAGEEVTAGENGDDRPRRRRGRRGGRRNRRGRNGDAPMDTPVGAPMNGHGGDAEGDVHETAGFDQPSAPEWHAPVAEPVTPPTVEAEFPAPAATPNEAEPPRRRSTVREPAPVGLAGSSPAPAPAPASPAPQPAISLSSPEESAQPKRGWWGKRLLGNKS
jgi:ribonuclease E